MHLPAAGSCLHTSPITRARAVLGTFPAHPPWAMPCISLQHYNAATTASSTAAHQALIITQCPAGKVCSTVGWCFTLQAVQPSFCTVSWCDVCSVSATMGLALCFTRFLPHLARVTRTTINSAALPTLLERARASKCSLAALIEWLR